MTTSTCAHNCGDQQNRESHYALLSIGEFRFALAVAALSQAIAPDTPLRTLPRRDGPVVGLLETIKGTLPVVDLRLWLDLSRTDATDVQPDGVHASAVVPEIVVAVEQNGRQLGILVSHIGEVRAVSTESLHRVHHIDHPEEIFDAFVDWPAFDSGVPVLDVSKTLDLLGIWTENEFGQLADGSDSAQGVGLRGERTPDDSPGVQVQIGEYAVWLPTECLRELVSTAALACQKLDPSGALTVAWWRENPLAVIGLDRADAVSGKKYVAVVGSLDGGALGIYVDRIERMWAWPEATSTKHSQQSGAHAYLHSVVAGEDGEPIYRLDIDALLREHPEASLAIPSPQGSVRRADSEAGTDVAVNADPYIVFEAPEMACIAVNRVREIVRLEQGSVDGITWRGQWLPLASITPQAKSSGQETCPPNLMAMIVGPSESLRAYTIAGLHMLVPAGQGKLHPWRKGLATAGFLLDVSEGERSRLINVVDW